MYQVIIDGFMFTVELTDAEYIALSGDDDVIVRKLQMEV